MRTLTQEQAIALALALAQAWCNETRDGETRITRLEDEGDCIGFRTHWNDDCEDAATATFTCVRQSDRIGKPAAWAVVEQSDCETFLHVDDETCFPVL